MIRSRPLFDHGGFKAGRSLAQNIIDPPRWSLRRVGRALELAIGVLPIIEQCLKPLFFVGGVEIAH